MPDFQTVKTWAPRLLFATVCGHYCLGWAYEVGLMHQIDLIAMGIFKHFVGRTGLSVFMPRFQAYSPQVFQSVASMMGALLFTGVEKTCSFVYQKMAPPQKPAVV